MNTMNRDLTVSSRSITKRFVRYKEGAELYSIGLNKFEKMARDAGACYKVDKLVLVNLDEFETYLRTFRLAN